MFAFLRGVVFSICLTAVTGAAEWQVLENLRLVEHPGNDGDSFRVTDGDSVWYLRLYFVDCPETDAATESMARRVREQTRYFGMGEHADTILYGKKATKRVKKLLAEPFTAYTVGADAMGRSVMQRIFAFVVTSEGKDLDKLLVREGLARSYGVGRSDFEGRSRGERRALLNDLEVEAMLLRRGIWSLTDGEKIAALRAEERAEAKELADIRRSLGIGPLAEGETLDPNDASVDELQRLPGIGPALAGRIVEARPYESPEDLLKVSGIGPATLARIRTSLEIPVPSGETIPSAK
ncbi:MAG: helix-hairpin-helix domain-containing protein [Opitutales bacterium]|nr:helix-hairpin-helix domain-containing protein [Opitutales bacterium]MCH8539378.1 helix-hairpin-helix domain-containing protein [Opitutales bacterium]